jgi:hypothetical protein
MSTTEVLDWKWRALASASSSDTALPRPFHTLFAASPFDVALRPCVISSNHRSNVSILRPQIFQNSWKTRCRDTTGTLLNPITHRHAQLLVGETVVLVQSVQKNRGLGILASPHAGHSVREYHNPTSRDPAASTYLQ